MKKVLFATTALIATAGMAAADVRLSGYGRFGLDYNEANGAVAGRSETNLTTRLRVQIDASTETDGGVKFGARYRIQGEQRDGAAGAGVVNGARFYVSSGGFTLGVGNIIGAIEGANGLYLPTSSAGTGIDGMGFHSLPTNVGVSYFNWDAYSSGGAGASNGVEVLYKAGAFAGHLSYSAPAGVPSADRLALNVSYTFGDWTAALAMQDSDTLGQDKIYVSVQGDLGVARVMLGYASNKDQNGTVGDDVDKLRLAGAFDLGAATTLVAWVANEDNPNAPATDGTSYGLNVSHDLGGGVTLDGGFVEHSDNNTQFQVGAYFRF
jgi:outer membrane protein OmpU